MIDLAEQVRAAILARKHLAEAAPHDAPWVADAEQEDPGVWLADLSRPGRCDQHEPGKVNLCDDRLLLRVDDFYLDYQAVITHIAANDPATVIRRCDADLAILNEHAPGPSGQPCDDGHIGWCDGCAQVCKTCPADPYDLASAYPCRTVRLLAEAYGVAEDRQGEAR